jgi:hypothetical protein
MPAARRRRRKTEKENKKGKKRNIKYFNYATLEPYLKRSCCCGSQETATPPLPFSQAKVPGHWLSSDGSGKIICI